MNLFTEILAEKAISLMDTVNDGLKEKDKFVFKGCGIYNNFFIIQAHSNLFGWKYNVLTDTGETPKGMSVCWRERFQVLEDLGIDLDKIKV